MPSDQYVTTRIRRDYLEKLKILMERASNLERGAIKSNTKMLHKLIDDEIARKQIAVKKRGPYKPRGQPVPTARPEVKPVALPPPE